MGSLLCKPLSTLIERCVKVSPDSPLVFFVGSGISTISPSALPSAGEMIAETVEAVAPAHIEGEEKKHLVTEALPEIYYELLADVVGNNAIEVWEALRFWKDHPALCGLGLGPNSGHLLLVYLAWLGKVPIITTNFDTLLEEAATKLQLTPVTSIPGDSRGYCQANAQDQVAIWKIHGSVDDLTSIQTTLRTITAADWGKLSQIREQFERDGADVCLIGYSGRDIDLFPFIADWPLSKRLFWVNKSGFSPDHMIHQQPSRFIAVIGLIEDWAKGVIERLEGRDVRIEILKQNLEHRVRGQDELTVKNVYKKVLREHIHHVLDPLLPSDDPKRLLIHALALRSVGENKRSWSYADRFVSEAKVRSVEPRLLCRGLLLQASLAHELSHYEDSQYFAETAQQVAKNNGLKAIEAEAIMAADEALRMQHLPRLGFRDWIHFLRLPAWGVFFSFIIHALTLRAKVRQSQELEHDIARARFIYIEHLIRLGAIVQAALLRLFPLPFVVRFAMKRWWHPIELRSYELGYAHGIANARKYAERLEIAPRTSLIISAGMLYGLLSARTGSAIGHRDRGEHLAEEARRAKTDKKRTEPQQQAIREFELGYQEAMTAGNASLALKILIDRRHLQKDFRANRAEVEALLNDIQGAGYRRLAADLLDWLCDGNKKEENRERP
jgi:hypothetical protein